MVVLWWLLAAPGMIVAVHGLLLSGSHSRIQSVEVWCCGGAWQHLAAPGKFCILVATLMLEERRGEERRREEKCNDGVVAWWCRSVWCV